MRLDLFGYNIVDTNKEKELKNPLPSFAQPTNDDGAMEVAPGGSLGAYMNFDMKAKTEGELITRYREMALQNECSIAIDDIINEMFVTKEEERFCVKLNLDEVDIGEALKNKIRSEFENVMKMMKFDKNPYDIGFQWYVDGRIVYHKMIDEKKTKDGIKELRNVDPRKIKKVRETNHKKDPKTGSIIFTKSQEYFLYNNTVKGVTTTYDGLKVAPDAICFEHSGIQDSKNDMILSHLHKAIKPLNQLRMLEDSVVIYRLARAPERRVFYVDVANLPKARAEQYVKTLMTKHKNRLNYNAETGEVSDDRRYLTMLEDLWMPRRSTGNSTEVTTLDGGQNLGEMDDIEYFKKKLLKALHVPVSRLESDTAFNIGRSSEITRDEVKFNKFIQRLRKRFTLIFDDVLRTQLVLKNIINISDWDKLRENIIYDFEEDNYFTELKNSEILRERTSLAADMDPFAGKYVSRNYIRKHVFRQTDEDMKEIDKEMEEEKKKFGDEEEDEDFFGGGGQQPSPEPEPKPVPVEVVQKEEEPEKEKPVKADKPIKTVKPSNNKPKNSNS